MSIKKLIPATIILLLLVTSCGLAGSPSPIMYTSGNQTSTPLTMPSAEAGITTPTTSPESVSIQCLQILVPKRSSLKISGRIILRDYQHNGPLFALDPSTGQITEILRSIGPHTIAAVSPNQQLLAYRENELSSRADELIIVDSDLVRRESMPWQASWLAIVNWINNEQLALLDAGPGTTMVILDSVTNQESPISFNQLPDFSNSVGHPWAEFDPAVQRVLYPIIGDEYSLFDLVAKKRIATLSSWTAEAPDASWSVDGGFVAVTGPNPKYYDNLGGSDEIFVISRNGQVEQATHLADFYGRGLGLYSPRWSPDGKQLAFWVQDVSNGKPNYVLAILDIITKTVTNLCISSDPSGYGGEFHETLPPPIWSPDGKQIIVESRFSEDHNRVILVDLSNKIAVEIAQDARPVGWMATQP